VKNIDQFQKLFELINQLISSQKGNFFFPLKNLNLNLKKKTK